MRAGQERIGAAQVDGEAALHAADDRAIHGFLRGERLLEARPGFLAARLLARDHGVAERVLDAVEVDLDDVAGLRLARAVVDEEFAQRDTAFGLEADIDDDEVVFDGEDCGGDDASLDHAAGAEALIEQGGEIFAGWVLRSQTFGLVQPYATILQ